MTDGVPQRNELAGKAEGTVTDRPQLSVGRRVIPGLCLLHAVERDHDYAALRCFAFERDDGAATNEEAAPERLERRLDTRAVRLDAFRIMHLKLRDVESRR